MKKPPKKGEPTKQEVVSIEMVMALRRDNSELSKELRKANKTALDAIVIAEQSQKDFESLKKSYEKSVDAYRRIEVVAKNMVQLNERLIKMLEKEGIDHGKIEKLN